MTCFSTFCELIKIDLMSKSYWSNGQFWTRYRVMGRVVLVIFLGWSTTLVAQTLFRIKFQSDEVGKLPSGWISWDEKNASRVYSVQAVNGKRFLHAESKGSRDQLGYEHLWSLREFPLLQWQWRAVVFPVNSNEREKSRNDSVLGLYMEDLTKPHFSLKKWGSLFSVCNRRCSYPGPFEGRRDTVTWGKNFS
jgi:hypothetical protein